MLSKKEVIFFFLLPDDFFYIVIFSIEISLLQKYAYKSLMIYKACNEALDSQR
jgi:hypothetical protein